MQQETTQIVEQNVRPGRTLKFFSVQSKRNHFRWTEIVFPDGDGHQEKLLSDSDDDLYLLSLLLTTAPTLLFQGLPSQDNYIVQTTEEYEQMCQKKERVVLN